ncbi:MAG: thermonuclease family protein [Gammaproteobacteria bacterium]|nr:thermonuclease family protein [Gammaproteobacteria bacterium]MDH5799939.1 thermonuclease family protein [Gammaproteobacteria bacterium]
MVQDRAKDCHFSGETATETVIQVLDGDTVRLQGGASVRLIGVNSPELGHDGQPDQELAREAKEFLQDLLQLPQLVQLLSGQKSRDHYGRRLAHMALLDGSNVQQLLLQAGLAFHISSPPNLTFNDCYVRAQRLARQAGLGVWALPVYGAIEAQTLAAEQAGFMRVVGRVGRITRTQNSLWLPMSKEFSLRIQSRDLVYFNDAELKKMIGSRWEVSGWVRHVGSQSVMLLRHPSVIVQPNRAGQQHKITK